MVIIMMLIMTKRMVVIMILIKIKRMVIMIKRILIMKKRMVVMTTELARTSQVYCFFIKSSQVTCTTYH